MKHTIIAGALFDFLGYLTTLPTPVTFGAAQHASPAVEHLEHWALSRGLSLQDAALSSKGGAA